MTAGEVPASVHTLVKGVLKTMFSASYGRRRPRFSRRLSHRRPRNGRLGRCRRFAQAGRPGPKPRPAFADQPRPARRLDSVRPGETWPLTLREAIHIGLENADEHSFDLDRNAVQDRPDEGRRRPTAVQGRGHGQGPVDRAAILEPGPVARAALELPIGPSAWPRRSSIASRPSCRSVAGRSPTSPRPPSASNSSTSTW